MMKAVSLLAGIAFMGWAPYTVRAETMESAAWVEHAQEHHSNMEANQESLQQVDFAAWSKMLIDDDEHEPDNPPDNQVVPVPSFNPSLLSLASSISSTNCPQFSGLFRGSASNETIWQHEVDGLINAQLLVSLEAGNNKRIVDMNARVDGSSLAISFVFAPGTDLAYFVHYSSWAALTSDWATKSTSGGVRLRKLEAYVLSGAVNYLAYYRAGSGGYALYQHNNLATFLAEKATLAKVGVQIIDFETFVVGGVRYYTGVFIGTPVSNILEQGLSFTSFVAKWKSYHSTGYRLLDFDRYQVGTTWTYAGVFTPGTDGQVLWIAVDEENFLSQIYEQSNGKRYLLSFEVNNGVCKTECCNDVVGTAYNYLITGFPDWFRWPVKDTFVRLSAVYWDASQNPKFRLPFSDKSVTQSSGWRYWGPNGTPGNYHHAADYSKGAATFAVRAIQSGKVVFVGWDNWSGNTIIVEHNGGWRSIYMHLRNGKKNDCNNAMYKSLPKLTDTNLDDYTAYLKNSGCWYGTPAENYWGTDSQTLMVTTGQSVAMGTQLAWAGNTGPGGKKGSSLSENTHLHIFFTRKDTDGNWYFVDPYGIYAYTGCYPTNILGPLTSCSRYSVAWDLGTDGKLKYSL